MTPLEGMWLGLRRLLRAWLACIAFALRYWRRQPAYSGPRMHAVRRLASGWGVSSGSNGDVSRHPLAKPDWVKAAVLQLAHDLPLAGCRSLANNFNLTHTASNQTVSKTWVASLLKARSAALALARCRSRRRRRFGGLGEPIQRVWGIDLTGLPLKSGETVDVWGIIDHGSRTVLQLEPVQKFNSLILLGKLLMAFGEFGIPKAVRSDNASVFRTVLFRATLRLQQGLRVMQEQMRFASFAAMQSVLSEFKDFYNHSRPHQSLGGRMPAMVWNPQVAKRREKKAQVKVKTARNKAIRQAAREPP
jgi:putative transposase